MPRNHPKNAVILGHIESSKVTMKEQKKATNYQGSTVYVLDSNDDSVPIGSNGELKGFGKSATVYKKVPTDSKAKQEMNNWAIGSAILFHNSQKMEEDARLGGDRGLLTRAVGSYQIDSYLGLNSLAEEKHGVDKNGKPIGISVQVDGVPVSGIKDGNPYALDIDYSDPRIQRGLFDLEVSDYITGQTDRHMQNVYIDSTTGKVKGIDNDLCLPEQPRSEVMKDSQVKSKSIVTKPTMMHEETAQKLQKADPNELRERLQRSHVPGTQPLSKDAIEGAVTRLKEIQSELRKGESSAIKVVKQFNKQTFDEAMKAQEVEHQKYNKRSMQETKAVYDKGQDSALFDFKGPKSSMLAKAAIEKIVGQIDTRNTVMHQDTNTAQRSADPQVLKAQEEGRAYQSMPRDQQKAFDKEFAKLAEKEKQLEKRSAHLKHLDKPTVLDKIASIGEGGVKGARKSDQKAIDKLRTEIQQLNQSLDNKLDAYRPKQQLAQDSQSRTVYESQSLGNTLTKDDLRQARRGGDTTTTPPQPQKSQSEKVDSTDSTKPTLGKQDSVRDLLRQQGAVKSAKEKLGVEGDKIGKGMDTAGINRDSTTPKTTAKIKK
jgi:hypothetical protein